MKSDAAPASAASAIDSAIVMRAPRIGGAIAETTGRIEATFFFGIAASGAALASLLIYRRSESPPAPAAGTAP